MGEAAAKEPSMEEILSSIRKIITDDGGSDVPATEAATPDNKPDIQIANTTKADRPSVAPSTAEIRDALAAIKENVRDVIAETKEVEVAAVEKSPEIVKPEIAKPIIAKPIVAEPIEAKVPEVESGPALEQADTISPPDMSFGEVDAAVSVAEVGTIKEPVVAEIAPKEAVEVEMVPKPIMAETVSEVPAQNSTSSIQDDKTMASNEAEDFKGALMSSNADQIVNEAFEELRRVTMDNIEDKTQALLRPMLSEWLDNNLPTLVERLVREEIERVSGGR